MARKLSPPTMVFLRKPLYDLIFAKTTVVTSGLVAPEVPASVGKTADFHAKHPSNLSSAFGRKRTLDAIDEWTVVGVALLKLHGRSCTYEQVRAKLVYATDFAQRKVEQSTVAPVHADDISALKQRDVQLWEEAALKREVQSVLEDMVWVCECERKGGEGGEVLGAWSEQRERMAYARGGGVPLWSESETQAAAAAKKPERKRKRKAPPKKKAEKKRKLQARPAPGFYGVCSISETAGRGKRGGKRSSTTTTRPTASAPSAPSRRQHLHTTGRQGSAGRTRR
jgi:hypothetical protein